MYYRRANGSAQVHGQPGSHQRRRRRIELTARRGREANESRGGYRRAAARAPMRLRGDRARGIPRMGRSRRGSPRVSTWSLSSSRPRRSRPLARGPAEAGDRRCRSPADRGAGSGSSWHNTLKYGYKLRWSSIPGPAGDQVRRSCPDSCPEKSLCATGCKCYGAFRRAAIGAVRQAARATKTHDTCMERER